MTDEQYIQPSLPDFANLTDDEICAYARSGVELLQNEAQTVADLSMRAVERAWSMGAGLVTLKARLGLEGEQWQNYVQQHISEDYGPVWKAMRFARQHKRPPTKKLAPGFKQLQIMFDKEVEPKQQPRREARHAFVNFKAACACIRRFWRGGDVLNGMSDEELDEVISDLAPLVEILEEARAAKAK
jgi:hypothetical protein